MLPTEEMYIAGIKQQNKIVFTQFRSAYHHAIYTLVLRIVKQHQAAEEVVQDTFMKVWLHGANFDSGKGKLYTWISNIARNSALDVIKSASYRRTQRITNTEDTLLRKEAKVPDPHLFDLKAHARALPSKYADVIMRFYFEGYSQEEISNELQIPIGTVKTRMREAVKRLRAHFQPSAL